MKKEMQAIRKKIGRKMQVKDKKSLAQASFF
jgi:hypothetical protein